MGKILDIFMYDDIWGVGNVGGIKGEKKEEKKGLGW